MPVPAYIQVVCGEGKHLASRSTIGAGEPWPRKILKGEQCLVIKAGPMNAPCSYSTECAQQILNDAWKKLASLYAALKLDHPWDG
jgi:hypothetical protein